jgi:uncharacterized lipoprotein NlpE involved in copper resistance
MKTKQFLVNVLTGFIVLSSITLTGCGGENKDEEKVTTEDLVLSPVADTVHTTMNSVDYAGTYKGTTPCADCEGIEVELTIGMDSSYTHSMKYLGKGDGKPVIKTGKYVWVDGGTIQLQGIDEGPSKFKVGEGRIWQLDLEGNKIEGELADRYILTKTN